MAPHSTPCRWYIHRPTRLQEICGWLHHSSQSAVILQSQTNSHMTTRLPMLPEPHTGDHMSIRNLWSRLRT
jgi:hypothetical protein